MLKQATTKALIKELNARGYVVDQDIERYYQTLGKWMIWLLWGVLFFGLFGLLFVIVASGLADLYNWLN